MILFIFNNININNNNLFKYNLKNKKFKCLKWNSKQEFIIK